MDGRKGDLDDAWPGAFRSFALEAMPTAPVQGAEVLQTRGSFKSISKCDRPFGTFGNRDPPIEQGACGREYHDQQHHKKNVENQSASSHQRPRVLLTGFWLRCGSGFKRLAELRSAADDFGETS